ncbi:MAG: histidine phosphatase family protein [Actinobacteria bacterium]|nr:histidine phosphatase family protein [Actinomycetota bacterium]
MLDTLHLVRHGEVANPGHLVYADLPGFSLSPLGRRQADAVAARLAAQDGAVIACSPLERARETAAPLAAALGTVAAVDHRLTEWGLLSRWAGEVWGDLAVRYPGEVEAYLTDPSDLPFSPEPLDAVAARMAAAVADLGAGHPGGTAVVVSHQDPVQALRFHLTGRPLAGLGAAKPGHGTVITLRWDGEWAETGRWDPPGA